MLDYITLSLAPGDRYVCDARDTNNRRLSVTVTKECTIEKMIADLVSQLDPSDKELYQLKIENAKINEQAAELIENAAKLKEANRNAAKTLAATFDGESISKYITWADAITKGFVNPGELVFYKGKMYTVISPTGTNDLMLPDQTPSAYLDVSEAINMDYIRMMNKPK